MSIKGIVYTCCPPAFRALWHRIEASDIGYRLARGGFWLLCGTVVSKALWLLASILVARMLGKETFGEFGIIRSTVEMFGVFAGFGLGLTATKYIAEFRRTDPELRRPDHRPLGDGCPGHRSGGWNSPFWPGAMVGGEHARRPAPEWATPRRLCHSCIECPQRRPDGRFGRLRGVQDSRLGKPLGWADFVSDSRCGHLLRRFWKGRSGPWPRAFRSTGP